MATPTEIFKQTVKTSIADKTAEGSVLNSDIAARFYDAADLITTNASNVSMGLAGPATAATNPGTPTSPKYYTFSTQGTYTNFKDASNASIVVNANEAGSLVYNGTYWTKQVIPVDISGKADASVLSALDADVYRKVYIDYITNMTTLPSAPIPADRTAVTFGSNIVTGSFFGEWNVYTGADGRVLNNVKVKTYVAGTVNLGLFRISGTTATLVYKQAYTSTGAGILTISRASITTDMNANEAAGKLYYALSFSAAGITQYIDNGSGGTGFSLSGAIVTSGSVATNNFSFSYWLEVGGVTSQLVATTKSNATSAAANTLAISRTQNMESGIVVYPTGRSGGITTPLANSFNTYYWGEFATYANSTRIISKIYVKLRAAGTYKIGFFRITGTTYTKISEQSLTAAAAGTITLTQADFPTIDLTFPAETGNVYVGYNFTTSGMGSYADISVTNNGWSYTPSTGSAGSVNLNTFVHDLWIETNLPVIPIVKAVADLQAAATSGEINLINCSKIVCIGDSYTESFYCLSRKSWINILSSFLDWNFENYGISGINMPNLIANLRNNVSYYESVAPRDYNGTYAIIASHTNDYTAGVMNATVHLETYLNNMRTLCRIVKSLGMIPIMCSEWVNIAVPNGTTSYSDLIGASLSILAQEEGGIYIDVLYKAQPMQGNLNTPFFGGNHPGTRSNSLVWHTLLKELQAKLPRPKTSLKLFKLRSAVTVTTVADLYFKDNLERAKLFQEIQVSENRIADAHANYYDDLDAWVALGAGRLTTKESEYLKLRKGASISMTDYSLISCVLPTEKKNIAALSLTLSETTVAVYYKDVLNDVWVSVTNTAGVITLTAADISKALDYDKIAFLLYKSGGFTLTNVKVNYAGISEKDLTFGKKKEITEFTVGEYLANQTVVSMTGWTVTGTLTPTVDVTNTLPGGITRYVDLTTANWLKQSVSIGPSTVRRRVQVKAWVRTFPAKFAYTDTFPANSVIKSDSYDFATLEISVGLDANNIAYSSKNVVPLWNTEVIMECDVPPYVNNIMVGFRSLDKTIQFMLASVKMS
jgi:hypothetical protein